MSPGNAFGTTGGALDRSQPALSQEAKPFAQALTVPGFSAPPGASGALSTASFSPAGAAHATVAPTSGDTKAATSSPAPPPLSFNSLAPNSLSSGPSSVAPAAGTAQAVGSGAIAATAGFNVAQTSAKAPSTPAGAASAGVLGAGSKPGASASPTAGAGSAAVATSVPSDIRNLNLEEVMNKWSEEIDELSSQFASAASMVSKWDRNIGVNEKAISELWKETQSCSVAHGELSANLDTILGQQRDLHDLLDALEREMDDLDRKNATGTSNGNNGAVSADIEREAMHLLAAEVMSDLDAMSLSIRDLVIELNKSGAGEGAGDTVAQVIAVLNAHLDSLQYLDESTGQLQKRLAEVSRACEIVTRDTRSYPRRSAGSFY
jgi:nuclear pore complex protein Nup62